MGLISLQQFYSLLIQLTRLPSFWNVWNEYFREHYLVCTSYCKENVPCGGKNKCPKIWEIKEVCHTQKFLQWAKNPNLVLIFTENGSVA